MPRCPECRQEHACGLAWRAWVEANCPICLELRRPFIMLPCGHGLCEACVVPLGFLPAGTCPGSLSSASAVASASAPVASTAAASAASRERFFDAHDVFDAGRAFDDIFVEPDEAQPPARRPWSAQTAQIARAARVAAARAAHARTAGRRPASLPAAAPLVPPAPPLLGLLAAPAPPEVPRPSPRDISLVPHEEELERGDSDRSLRDLHRSWLARLRAAAAAPSEARSRSGGRRAPRPARLAPPVPELPARPAPAPAPGARRRLHASRFRARGSAAGLPARSRSRSRSSAFWEPEALEPLAFPESPEVESPEVVSDVERTVGDVSASSIRGLSSSLENDRVFGADFDVSVPGVGRASDDLGDHLPADSPLLPRAADADEVELTEGVDGWDDFVDELFGDVLSDDSGHVQSEAVGAAAGAAVGAFAAGDAESELSESEASDSGAVLGDFLPQEFHSTPATEPAELDAVSARFHEHSLMFASDDDDDEVVELLGAAEATGAPGVGGAVGADGPAADLLEAEDFDFLSEEDWGPFRGGDVALADVLSDPGAGEADLLDALDAVDAVCLAGDDAEREWAEFVGLPGYACDEDSQGDDESFCEHVDLDGDPFFPT